MTEKQRKFTLWILAAAAAAFYFLTGGGTVVILNRTPAAICEAYFAYHPERAGWGRDRLWAQIPPGQSRDIRLPLSFGWFQDGREGGYMGRLVSCEGDEVESITGIVEKVYYWEVR